VSVRQRQEIQAVLRQERLTAEIRNPKQIRMTQKAIAKLVWNISDSDFGFVSSFGLPPLRSASHFVRLRYSDLSVV
jgi:hypothetical protein